MIVIIVNISFCIVFLYVEIKWNEKKWKIIIWKVLWKDRYLQKYAKKYITFTTWQEKIII